MEVEIAVRLDLTNDEDEMGVNVMTYLESGAVDDHIEEFIRANELANFKVVGMRVK